MPAAASPHPNVGVVERRPAGPFPFRTPDGSPSHAPQRRREGLGYDGIRPWRQSRNPGEGGRIVGAREHDDRGNERGER